MTQKEKATTSLKYISIHRIHDAKNFWLWAFKYRYYYLKITQNHLISLVIELKEVPFELELLFLLLEEIIFIRYPAQWLVWKRYSWLLLKGPLIIHDPQWACSLPAGHTHSYKPSAQGAPLSNGLKDLVLAGSGSSGISAYSRTQWTDQELRVSQTRRARHRDLKRWSLWVAQTGFVPVVSLSSFPQL